MSRERDQRPPMAFKGRGAVANPGGRFEPHQVAAVDDGWDSPDVPPEAPETVIAVDRARTVLTYNRSPDIAFDRSVNPYRGCEHGCVYCFARPTHAYLGLSPGLDFETRLFYKPDAPALLRRELSHPGYRPAPIALGVNTDAYQPVEKRLRITRGLLEVLWECRHPVGLVTKSGLLARDLDLLAPMAAEGLAHVFVTLTSLDADLGRTLEPRAAGPQRRLKLIEQLTAAGVPVGVLIAPVIPVLTDAELESLLAAARAGGASSAGYVLLRLPHEVAPLFEAWLQTHRPLQAAHVLSLLRQMHGGPVYRAEFGHRMRGAGPYAQLLAQRFRLAARRLGLDRGLPPLDASRFRRPSAGAQLSLF